MTHYDDDTSVSGNDLPDIVTMAMARRTLRGLVPDAPPAPSAQLAVVLREGLTVAPAAFGWHRLTGRLASLGLAAKLMLAAGVAVASAGGAATAVAFTHDSSHHGDHPDSPRNHPAVVIPTAASGARADDRPEHGGRPAQSTTEVERHAGADDSSAGSGEGQSADRSGSDDSTSGSHDGGSGSGSGTDGGDSGSTSTSGGSTDTSGGSSDSGSSGSGGGSDSGSGSLSGSGTDGGSGGGTSDGGTSGH